MLDGFIIIPVSKIEQYGEIRLGILKDRVVSSVDDGISWQGFPKKDLDEQIKTVEGFFHD